QGGDGGVGGVLAGDAPVGRLRPEPGGRPVGRVVGLDDGAVDGKPQVGAAGAEVLDVAVDLLQGGAHSHAGGGLPGGRDAEGGDVVHRGRVGQVGQDGTAGRVAVVDRPVGE